jgi:putative ubiquitin-RnfH superfamily antitoxin RatB of RatAB toxin-antitoxin module
MEHEARPARIEVVYALPDEADVVTLTLEPGMTAGSAVEASGILVRHPEAGKEPVVLGVFGERVSHDRLLAPGDRVEICRPLPEDPRKLRMRLQQAGQVIGSTRRDQEERET